jgi:predicted metal-binding transcription factor (methanogenesis marker protein 9)
LIGSSAFVDWIELIGLSVGVDVLFGLVVWKINECSPVWVSVVVVARIDVFSSQHVELCFVLSAQFLTWAELKLVSSTVAGGMPFLTCRSRTLQTYT